jgi:hypothetical protein
MAPRDIKPEYRRPLRATPGHGVVGVDMNKVIERCAKSILERAEAGEKRMREQDAQWKYETRESFTFIVEAFTKRIRAKVIAGYKATSVTEIGAGQVWAKAPTLKALEAEVRFTLAQQFMEQKMCRDYEECRRRASLCELYFDRSIAKGSK